MLSENFYFLKKYFWKISWFFWRNISLELSAIDVGLDNMHIIEIVIQKAYVLKFSSLYLNEKKNKP